MELLDGILTESKFQKPRKLTKFTVNIYDRDDYDNLMDLYESVFPGYMDENLWNWKSNKNPFGKFLTILMKDGAKIIGAYSVAPKLFFLNGKKSPCVQSMDTMTDENYRSLGISTYLGNLTYEYAKRKGYNFVYGFPNEISRYLFDVKLKWNTIIKSNYLEKILTDVNIEASPIKNRFIIDNREFYITEIKIFDEKVNELWDKNNKSYPVIIEKKNNYLNWRFIEHPQIEYQKFYVFDDTETLISYFVLKKYKKANNELVGHIVDLLIVTIYYPLKIKIFQMIENYSVEKFKKECKMISFWSSDILFQEFTDQNFSYKSIKNMPYFGYKKFREVKELKVLDNLENWYITMSNEDVF